MRRFFLAASASILFLLVAGMARAGLEQVQFPVSSLDNCASREACTAYCDVPDHTTACLQFAEREHLVSPEEAGAARELLNENGPGGCKSAAACQTYCDDTTHAENCLNFAEQHGLVGAQEAALARTVVRDGGPGGCKTRAACEAFCEDPVHVDACLDFAVKNGIVRPAQAQLTRTILTEGGPGGCFNEASCKAYCENQDHLDACVSFAEAHGFMTHDAAEQARKTQGRGPGGCVGESACRAYCDDATHADACVSFAEAQGFISHDDAARVQKLSALSGPGGCRGETACRAYCDDVTHSDECLHFAVQNGFIKPEEAAQAQKIIMQAGPGGCHGEACRSYCDNADHAGECLQFAADKGLAKPEDISRMQRGLEIMQTQGGPGGCRTYNECGTFCSKPENQDTCTQFGRDHHLISSDEVQRIETTRGENDVKKQELLKIVETSGGPGGCRDEAACRQYCGDASHQAECYAFGSEHGYVPPPSPAPQTSGIISLPGVSTTSVAGPGGCQGPEECARYCSLPSNFDDCRRFAAVSAPSSPAPITARPTTAPAATPLPTITTPSPEVSPFTNPNFQGPGGCKSPAECFRYCTDHPQECNRYAPPPAMSTAPGSERAVCPATAPPTCSYGVVFDSRTGCPTGGCVAPPHDEANFVGPGGCRGADECRIYCGLHPDECSHASQQSPCPVAYPPTCGSNTTLATEYTPQGCPTYICRPQNHTECPPITAYCPYGFVNDPQTGCGTNVCHPAPVQCPPPLMLMCRQGFVGVTAPGPNGCPVIECRSPEVIPHPCPEVPERECTINEERVVSTHDGCTISYCRAKDQPPPIPITCPAVTAPRCPHDVAAVRVTLSSGCAGFQCPDVSTCPPPPSCTYDISHSEDSACPVYTCRGTTPLPITAPCPQITMPTCSGATPYLQPVMDAANHCPLSMTCSATPPAGATPSSGNCPTTQPPSCGTGATLDSSTDPTTHCPVYTCRSITTPSPVTALCPQITMPTCSGATPYLVPTMDAANHCPLSMTCNATPPAGASGSGMGTGTGTGTGSITSGTPSSCPQPPVCAGVLENIMTTGAPCPSYVCHPSSTGSGTTPPPPSSSCPPVMTPTCGPGQTPRFMSDPVSGCGGYMCASSSSSMPPTSYLYRGECRSVLACLAACVLRGDVQACVGSVSPSLGRFARY